MPATAQGPATCKSGGEYKKIQVCPGMPRCIRNEVERKKAQAVKYGCGMCQQTWVFVEPDGKVHRQPDAADVKKHAVKSAEKVLKAVVPEFAEKKGSPLDQRIYLWLKAARVAIETKQIREAFSDYDSGTVKNALYRLKIAGMIESPKYGFWRAR